MKIAVVKEQRANELRVAASPETVKKLSGLGFEVMVESGAGAPSHFSDDAFKDAGAAIGSDAAETLSGADVIFKVGKPTDDELSHMKRGAMLNARMPRAASTSAVSTIPAISPQTETGRSCAFA